jgi:hypothetical protein
VAEMPVYLSQANRDLQKAPQKKIDEFWKKFTTKAPGKGTYPHFLFFPLSHFYLSFPEKSQADNYA